MPLEIRTRRVQLFVNPGPSGRSVDFKWREVGSRYWRNTTAIPLGLRMYSEEEERWLQELESEAGAICGRLARGEDPGVKVFPVFYYDPSTHGWQQSLILSP